MTNTGRPVWPYALLVALAAAGAFYWYEWRPVSIRKTCLLAQERLDQEQHLKILEEQKDGNTYEYTRFLLEKAARASTSLDTLRENLERQTRSETVKDPTSLPYDRCVRAYGLEI